jgi:RNA polymerase sigma-70 factor (ECF subfamily)
VLRTAQTRQRGEWRRTRRQDASDAPETLADPEQQLHARELADRLETALALLPERRRQAALLRWDAGLSHAEIATALGTTDAAARQLVFEATKALRALLGADAAKGA